MTQATAAPATPATGTDSLLDLFGVCLHVHSLLYIHKDDPNALPGLSEAYADLHATIERVIGV